MRHEPEQQHGEVSCCQCACAVQAVAQERRRVRRLGLRLLTLALFVVVLGGAGWQMRGFFGLRFDKPVTVGPYSLPESEGMLGVTGSGAGVQIARRTLTDWPISPAAGDRYQWYNPDASLRLWTQGTGDLLTVTSTGLLGVGTTGPSQKLSVNGTVYSTAGGFKFPDGTVQNTASSGVGVLRQVHQGSADIDAAQSEKFYVHVFGSLPTRVLLYMRGEKYNPAFYTELGQHTHTFTGDATGNASVDHTHVGPSHSHNVYLDTGSGSTAVQGTNNPASWRSGLISSTGGATSGQSATHTHTTSGTNANAGVNGGTLSSAVKTYTSGATVWIDGIEKTANILTLSGLAALGDGTATHGFVTSGTGQMDVTSLITWGVGEHTVELRQAGIAGGKIRYVLYVEY